jgi:peptide/nickel transport system permease protein/oligopeptide transport system permease protein
MMAGTAANVDVEKMREQLGLNEPLPSQYFHYMSRVFQGDLGRSLIGRRPVGSEFGDRFPNTALLAVTSTLLSLVLGVSVGIISGTKPNSHIDYVVTIGAVLGVSVPLFWLGLMLMLLFALRLGWFPVAGVGSLKHIVLPSITLAAPSTAIIARLTRSGLINEMGENYVQLARAKGLSEWAVIMGHALRNSLIPVVTVSGLQFGNLLGGAVITEIVFAWPGVGSFLVDSILARDFPVVQGFVLLLASGLVLINLLTDLLYAVLDPRIRYE